MTSEVFDKFRFALAFGRIGIGKNLGPLMGAKDCSIFVLFELLQEARAISITTWVLSLAMYGLSCLEKSSRVFHYAVSLWTLSAPF